MKRKIAAALAFALITVYSASCAPAESDVVGVSVGRVTVAAGSVNLALRPDGSLWAWGWNEPSDTPAGDLSKDPMPTPVCIMEEVFSIENGGLLTLLLRTDSSLWMINREESSLMVFGTEPFVRLESRKVIDNVVAASAGAHHGMAILDDASLWGWGRNTTGQVGDGNVARWSEAAWIMNDVAAVTARLNHTMAIKTDGSLWAWGWNSYGQLGNGTVDQNRNDATCIRSSERVPNWLFLIKEK